MRIIHKNLNVLMLILSLLLGNFAMAQQTALTGKVTDNSSGETLPGVSIAIKGTTIGTITDMDGQFTLNVKRGDVLQFSFVGYKSQEIPFTGQKSLAVSLEVSREQLDEVVVIGYGQVKKSDATGAIATVSSKDFSKGAITSPQDLLVGKSAGVVITTAGGAPGSGATIRIRGGSSLNASNDPLIIIDGVPISNDNIGGSSNFLSFVNPNDIETFTVLKDASSTAIYGSRASNGVILITTKKGKVGSPMKITYDGNTSVSSATKFLDVYSGDQMRQIAFDHKDLYGADTYSKLGVENTNWQKEIFRTAISQDHNLSLSGAYKTMPYRISVGYTDQNGILKNTDMKRLTGSVSLDPTFFNGGLKVSMNAKGMNTDNNFGDAGAVGSAINMDPTKPVKDGNPASDGYFQWSNYGANLGTPNPVEQLLAADNKFNVKRVIANAQFDYKIPFIPELHANLNLATDYTESAGHNNRPTTAPSTLTGTFWGQLQDSKAKNHNDLLDFYLNYVKDLSQIKSKIDLTAGYSWQHFQQEKGHYNRGYYDATHLYQKPDSIPYSFTENYLVSFFGRMNYTFMNKYLLTATLRDDGSSRFTNNKWGLFPSAAFAWKINNESFLKDNATISDMKLRLGYGVTGQQDINQGDYPYIPVYQINTTGAYYQFGSNYYPTARPNAYNPSLKWEQTTTSNVGFDLGLLNNRFTGSIDYYFRQTTDLLNSIHVPVGTNFSNVVLSNIGSLQNQGLELTLNGKVISTKETTLDLGFNITNNQNKITKLTTSDAATTIINTGNISDFGTIQAYKVGFPTNSFLVYQQVYSSQGIPIQNLYVDRNGDGQITSADMYLHHKPSPDFTMGFSAKLIYKGFDLSTSWRSSIGNYVYNDVAAEHANLSTAKILMNSSLRNKPTSAFDTNFSGTNIDYKFSDYYIEDASFLKCDNITVGYSFKKLFKVITSGRISATVQNAFIITKYKGLDPEVFNGIDQNIYPRPITTVIGLSLNF